MTPITICSVSTADISDYYERNAKRLITVWGPPVDDYSARIWSGLVRDYYLPRWQNWFEYGTEFDFASWEEDWVRTSEGVSPIEKYENPIQTCVSVINNQ